VSVSTAPISKADAHVTPSGRQRGLTVRSFVVAVFALLLLGIWVEYEELFCFYGGPLTENAPPNGAIGVILIVLAISALLYLLRRSLRLASAELVFILAALLVAAPLMTQGMWHRLVGLLASIPHNEDFKSYESLPPMLWPHGSNLVKGPFNGEDTLGDFTRIGDGALQWTPMAWPSSKKTLDCPVLVNAKPTDTTALELRIPVEKGKHTLLVPGENFLFSCLVKTEGFQAGSSYYVRMQADGSPEHTVLLSSAPTSATFALPQGFQRIGKCPVQIPVYLDKTLILRIGLTGPGKLTLQDVQFLNSQAIEGLYTGVKVRRASQYATLGKGERDFTLKQPDALFSFAGLGYIVHGFIPLTQWALPLFAWTLLIGALFLGFMGFNVLMRRQWVDSERFTFPMNILPRQLFTEEEDTQGRPYLAIFRNKVMWIGFSLMMILALSKGLHFYFPAVPAPSWSNMWSGAIRLDSFVTDPLLKAFFANASISLVFSLFAIALLVETDILFSMWASFLLFQLTALFGKAFNWNKFVGYPWEWQQGIGSFIGYALVALVAARRHLGRIWRHLIGKERLDDSGEVVSYRMAVVMILLSLGIIIGWGVWTRMGWVASLLFFSLMLIIGFTSSKVRAEAGMPFGYWMPYYSMWFVSAIGGFAVFGATGMLVATIASGFMCVACFFFIAPVQVEMMELGRHFQVKARDISHGLWLGLLGGIVIGGFVILCWAYGFGADNMATTWPYGQNWYFTNYRNGEVAIDRAFIADPTQLMTPSTEPLNIVENVDAKGIAIGLGVTGLLAALRSLFMWFPLHPLGYVLATTYFARTVWFTCLVAWFVRLVVLRIGGAHSIRKGLIPFCVGMFLACITSVIIFDIVGLYLRTIGITAIYAQIP
jgi:hypothetical protein